MLSQRNELLRCGISLLDSSVSRTITAVEQGAAPIKANDNIIANSGVTCLSVCLSVSVLHKEVTS
jgi:hypothetical protein